MTLQQLKYAVAVADTLNITEASKRVFISQPSLTAAIHELEDEMGVTIFNRSNKGVTITQFLAENHYEEDKVLDAAMDYLEKNNAGYLVTYNGCAYDVPFLNARPSYRRLIVRPTVLIQHRCFLVYEDSFYNHLSNSR